jgi:hypothetical protein
MEGPADREYSMAVSLFWSSASLQLVMAEGERIQNRLLI